ncbi:MAG: DUF4235 domain-containing protein [Solirubrobacteraceae bacterium]
MVKLMFAPISLIASRIAGLTGRKLAERVWSLIDKRRPPQPDEPARSWGKLVAALAIEGAIFRLVSGLADQAARRWFARLTGRWPGDQPEADGEPTEK